jgi:hypothetical protein
MAEDSQNSLGTKSYSVAFAPWDERLLALEIRPGRFGFAVFEGVTTLLDWGVRAHDGKSLLFGSTAPTTIERLIDLYAPGAIVARQQNASPRHAPKQISAIVRGIKSAAARRSIELHLVDPTAIQRFYAGHDLRTKHQIATAISEWFDELSWKLPPKRRLWEAEPFNLLIFDAVGTAVAFMASERTG